MVNQSNFCNLNDKCNLHLRPISDGVLFDKKGIVQHLTGIIALSAKSFLTSTLDNKTLLFFLSQSASSTREKRASHIEDESVRNWSLEAKLRGL